MKEKDCQQKWSAKTPPAKGNSRFLSPSRSSHFTWSPSLGLNKTLGNQGSHGNPKRVTRANYFTSAQTTSSMGNFHHENRKKKKQASLQQKNFEENSWNSPITEPCTWDQGRRNLRSLSFRSDSVLCLQGKETKLRLVEASTTKLQRHVLKMWKELLGWKILLSLARSFALLAIVSYRGWMLRLRRLSLVTKVHALGWITWKFLNPLSRST